MVVVAGGMENEAAVRAVAGSLSRKAGKEVPPSVLH